MLGAVGLLVWIQVDVEASAAWIDLGSVYWGAHLLHIALSGFATAALLAVLRPGTGLGLTLALGGGGAIVLASLSDCGAPHLGATATGLTAGGHGHATGVWWALVVPALVGCVAGWMIRRPGIGHALHLVISTIASAAHIGLGAAALSLSEFGPLIGTLVIAVWLPCWISDALLPLVASRLPKLRAIPANGAPIPAVVPVESGPAR